MAKIVFILTDGRRQEVEMDDFPNAMLAAQFAGVQGITGACGGFCSCATCHVFVESSHALQPIAAAEDAMLKKTAAKRNQKSSRLACQIVLSDALDGLVLRIADKQ